MNDVNYFSTPSYREGQSFTFHQPQHSEWIIQSQLSQRNSRASKDEVAAGKAISYAVATFRVKNSHDREARPAYTRVYMQVPWAGTEFAEYEERSKQAATTWVHDEVRVLKDFHTFGSKVTPELFAIDERIQGPQGHVPGGPVVQVIFEWVPGVRLAEDNFLPEYRNQPYPFFRDFSRTQRDEIRKSFIEGSRSLEAMGWDIEPDGGKSLVWNTEKSQMFFVDFRYPIRVGICSGISTMGGDLVHKKDTKPDKTPPAVLWWIHGLAIPMRGNDISDPSNYQL